jgi:hypothetical protein
MALVHNPNEVKALVCIGTAKYEKEVILFKVNLLLEIRECC